MSAVTRLDDLIERSNHFLAEEVQRLHEIIRDERATNRMLLKRLGIIEDNQRDVRLGEVNPIGGITPLRTRIRDLEAEYRQKAREFENASEE